MIMGRRDRERRERGEFIVKRVPPSAPKLVVIANQVAHQIMLELGIPHVLALRRPLPREDEDKEATQ